MVARLEVEIDRIFLDQENPRHKPYESQSEVIDYFVPSREHSVPR